MELSLIRDIIAIFGVIAGLSYYVITVRNQNKQRNAQLFIQYHDKIMSNPLKNKQSIVMSWKWENYDDFEEKYGKLPDASNFYVDAESVLWNLFDVLAYYEGLGVLMSKHQLDLEMVIRFNGGLITRFWEKFESLIYEWRRRQNLLNWWVEFENLYLKIGEYWKRNTVVVDMVATIEPRRQALGLPKY